MAFQGERVPGVLGMDLELVESMAQDENPEQEMLIGQDEFPQPNPEPEMGAAAVAAVYNTSPPLLRQGPPPVPGESTPNDGEATATDPPNMGQLLTVLLAKMDGNAQQMNEIKKQDG